MERKIKKNQNESEEENRKNQKQKHCEVNQKLILFMSIFFISSQILFTTQ